NDVVRGVVVVGGGIEGAAAVDHQVGGAGAEGACGVDDTAPDRGDRGIDDEATGRRSGIADAEDVGIGAAGGGVELHAAAAEEDRLCGAEAGAGAADFEYARVDHDAAGV